MVPVAKAAEKAKTRAVDVLHLVLGGHLDGVARVAGEEGIAALRVDPEEVKRVASSLMTDLSPSDAFGALRIPVRSGWALIDGVGDGIQLPHRPVVGADGCHVFVRDRREDVEAFAREFTTVVRIAREIGGAPEHVAAMIKAERLRLCVTRQHLGVDLIRRSDPPAQLVA